MSIYQFLIAVRQKDGEMLTNDAGETTRRAVLFLKRGGSGAELIMVDRQSSDGFLLSYHPHRRKRHQTRLRIRRETTRAESRRCTYTTSFE